MYKDKLHHNLFEDWKKDKSYINSASLFR